MIQSEAFFEGRYQEKVIQVDSSKTGKDEEEMIERLLRVEQATWTAIRRFENNPHIVPSVRHLQKPEIQAAIVKAVEAQQPS